MAASWTRYIVLATEIGACCYFVCLEDKYRPLTQNSHFPPLSRTVKSEIVLMSQAVAVNFQNTRGVISK